VVFFTQKNPLSTVSWYFLDSQKISRLHLCRLVRFSFKALRFGRFFHTRNFYTIVEIHTFQGKGAVVFSPSKKYQPPSAANFFALCSEVGVYSGKKDFSLNPRFVSGSFVKNSDVFGLLFCLTLAF